VLIVLLLFPQSAKIFIKRLAPRNRPGHAPDEFIEFVVHAFHALAFRLYGPNGARYNCVFLWHGVFFWKIGS
jgi:hypothetical protein